LRVNLKQKKEREGQGEKPVGEAGGAKKTKVSDQALDVIHVMGVLGKSGKMGRERGRGLGADFSHRGLGGTVGQMGVQGGAKTTTKQKKQNKWWGRSGGGGGGGGGTSQKGGNGGGKR